MMQKAGWAATAIAALMIGASAAMKLAFVSGRMKEMSEAMAHLGIAESLVLTIAIIEILCVMLYLIPRTSILGAILLTGYLGGAVFTHLRVGDQVFGPLLPGILVWVGLYLRDPRIRALIPLREN